MSLRSDIVNSSTVRLPSRWPLWKGMELLDLNSQWQKEWESASVVNSFLVSLQPGFDLPRCQCSLLYRSVATSPMVSAELPVGLNDGVWQTMICGDTKKCYMSLITDLWWGWKSGPVRGWWGCKRLASYAMWSIRQQQPTYCVCSPNEQHGSRGFPRIYNPT